MLYVPKGFAHGFQTLENDTEVIYFVTQKYTPKFEMGFRYDDPYFQINWPYTVNCVSEKDMSWPNYDPKYHNFDDLNAYI